MQTSENTRQTAAAYEAEFIRVANSPAAGQTAAQAFAASMWASAIDAMMRETR